MIQPVPLEELKNTATFLQSGVWGRIKLEYSWKPYGFMYNNVPLLILTRALPGNIVIGYVPHGPGVPMDLPFFTKFAEGLKELLPGVTFLRFDLPWDRKPGTKLGKPFKKSPVEVQPPDTVLIDISQSEEELLSQMKKKTRYNIRLAEKKGVTVRQEGMDMLVAWYEIYQETSLRDKIRIHTYDYYLTVFSEFEKDENAQPVLLCAYYEEKMIAGIFLIKYGKRVTYVYGASSDSYRNVMPNYLLQWEAMRFAKNSGCREYDMFGIPPEENPDHPMNGLYRFKTGFGGAIVHMEGSWDYALKPITYRLYRFAEKLRNFYYKKILKR